jgi:GNAT superfamily N-acetyltransferase
MATDQKSQKIQVGPLKASELKEADRIVRLAFGTFLGMPDPMTFMEDRDFLGPRLRSKNVKVVAARDGGRLIGSNFVTRWGCFGFFGPLTVLPEYWDHGVAQKLLEATVGAFDKWGVRHSGLFTFASSAKHVGLYQKFGYWPQHLTAVMTRTPEPNPARMPELLSALKKAEREEVIAAAAKVAHRISKGLDLTDEIRSVLAQRTGDVVLERRRGVLNGFAICMTGAGSEGGEKICYIKFGAARDGKAAEEHFGRLLEGCEAYAALKGTIVEAGTNLARGEAFRHMRSRGYRVTTQGVAMQRPNTEGFNRANCWVIDDWR